MSLCVHCKRYEGKRPRGLCYSCYFKPSIRDMYFSNLPTLDRHYQDLTDGAKRLPEPTDALPGSEEKKLILEARFMNQQVLHHPDDHKFVSRSATLGRFLVGKRCKIGWRFRDMSQI